MQFKLSAVIIGCALVSACGCSKYASSYSCSYVEKRADYEIWYWRKVADDDENDNVMIGHATGIRQCEDNARAFAAAVNDSFSSRS